MIQSFMCYVGLMGATGRIKSIIRIKSMLGDVILLLPVMIHGMITTIVWVWMKWVEKVWSRLVGYRCVYVCMREREVQVFWLIRVR